MEWKAPRRWWAGCSRISRRRRNMRSSARHSAARCRPGALRKSSPAKSCGRMEQRPLLSSNPRWSSRKAALWGRRASCATSPNARRRKMLCGNPKRNTEICSKIPSWGFPRRYPTGMCSAQTMRMHKCTATQIRRRCWLPCLTSRNSTPVRRIVTRCCVS